MRKTLLTVLLTCWPAAAQAVCMTGTGGCCMPHHGGLALGFLFAALAALGYGVLQHADRQNGSLVKRAGLTVGLILILLGLAGLLCAVAGHIKASCHKCCVGHGPSEAMMAPAPGGDVNELPAGHPPVGGMMRPESGKKKGVEKK